MSNLVVLGLDNREDAERVMDLAGDLAKQHLLELDDVAYAYRDDKGKVRIQQSINLTGAGAASGALWGTLIGMLFLMPIAGLAIGAGTGALAGKLSDVGVNDDTIKQIGEQLQPEGLDAVEQPVQGGLVLDRAVEHRLHRLHRRAHALEGGRQRVAQASPHADLVAPCLTRHAHPPRPPRRPAPSASWPGPG